MKILFFLPAMLLAACANLPQAERVGEFGKATTAATAFAKESLVANKTIALRINDELLAYTYLTGKACPPKGDVGYSESCVSTPFQLSGGRARILSSDATGTRLRALAALGEYGDALAKAADQGQIDKLENAAVKVGDAAASLTAAFPPASPVAVPAIKLVARGVGFALGSAYAAEINWIVRASNGDIKKLTKLLQRDFDKLAGLLAEQAKAFEEARRANLAAMRYRGEVDRLRLYGDFKNARQDYATVASLALAASRFSDIFEQIAETHDALAKEEQDAEKLLRKLIVLIGDATEVVKAAQAEKNS